MNGTAPPREATEPLQVASRRKRGRPSKLTETVRGEILERIALGECLMQVCRDPSLPDRRNVQRLVHRDPDFRRALSHARESWAYAQVDEMLAIADNSSNDWETYTFGGREYTRPNREAINRAKLRVWSRQYLIERFLPKVFSGRTLLQRAEPADDAVRAEMAALVAVDRTEVAP